MIKTTIHSKYKLLNTKYSQGFTIIEMLVTLSVVTLLTVMVIGYSRRSESLTNLIRESERLMYYFKLAQNSSMLTLKSNSENVCGWGVGINTTDNQYFLFSDSCSGTRYAYDSSDTITETIQPLNGIIIKESNINSIVFVPPNPDVFSDPTTVLQNGQAQITLCLASDLNQCINVYVNKAGLIYKH